MADTEDLNDTYPSAGTFQFGDSKKMWQILIDLVCKGGFSAFSVSD